MGLGPFYQTVYVTTERSIFRRNQLYHPRSPRLNVNIFLQICQTLLFWVLNGIQVKCRFSIWYPQDQPININRKKQPSPQAPCRDDLWWLNNHQNIITFVQHSYYGDSAAFLYIPAKTHSNLQFISVKVSMGKSSQKFKLLVV